MSDALISEALPAVSKWIIIIIIPKEYVYIIPSLAFGIELEYDRVWEEHIDAYQGCWFHLK